MQSIPYATIHTFPALDRFQRELMLCGVIRLLHVAHCGYTKSITLQPFCLNPVCFLVSDVSGVRTTVKKTRLLPYLFHKLQIAGSDTGLGQENFYATNYLPPPRGFGCLIFCPPIHTTIHGDWYLYTLNRTAGLDTCSVCGIQSI